MRRRDVIALMAGGASLALPFAAGAQSRIVPVIGFLNSGSQSAFAGLADAFRQGLGDEGYVEGNNVRIEYRWADGDYARLPALVTDLIQHGVALLAATGGTPAARAAKAITQTLPILFVIGSDPVKIGLAASVSRPGGNATGVNVVTTDLVRKRVELLHEVVPDISTIALMLNPGSTSFEYERTLAVESEKEETAAAAQNAGVRLIMVQATADSDFEPAFASAIKNGARGLLVSADPFLTDRRALIIALAARHKMPAIYPWRQYPAAGGLMSYGPSIAEAYRQIGRYAGRILKGAKPADLPVQIPAKFELVLNLTAAQTLGVEISPWLLARADEVIK
jgi:putative tryptophan/tyrosine transport system substrate-binding protein